MAKIIYNDFIAYDELNTLTDIKNYLRISFDDDDVYLQRLLDTTLIYIDSCVGKNYRMIEKGVNLAKLLQCKLIADLYENRSTTIADNLVQDTITTTILEALNSYNYDDWED